MPPSSRDPGRAGRSTRTAAEVRGALDAVERRRWNTWFISASGLRASAHVICDRASARGLRVDAIVPGITKVGL
jgi:hypothetical protein